MLQSLHIVNFAIIEDTIIELTDGATVFTGETGAGKSILIDALAILLGRRARTDLIRTGAEFFKVEGVFSADDEIVSILSSFNTIFLSPSFSLISTSWLDGADSF